LTLVARTANDSEGEGKENGISDRLHCAERGHVLDETTVPEVSENDGTDQDAENEKGDFPGDFRLGFGTLDAVKKHVFCMLRLFLPVLPGPDTLVLDAKSTTKFRVVKSWVLSRCTSGVFDHSPARVAQ